MSDLNEIYFKKETLETMLKVVNAKGQKGLDITVSRNNEPNTYGQNVAAFVAQTKEEREAGKTKFYVANGKTFWTDGTNVPAVKTEAKEDTAKPAAKEAADDLPF